MKYICLGYLEPGKFENMSESERNTMLDECFSRVPHTSRLCLGGSFNFPHPNVISGRRMARVTVPN